MPDNTTPATGIGTGPGRLLTALYALFALAATGRSAVQLLLYAERAPLAYGLSAVAAVIYLLATTCFLLGDRARIVAIAACTVEAVGVLVVGAASYLVPEAFPDRTVWSHFGQGYGYLPLVLPFMGLWWLLRARGSFGAGEPGYCDDQQHSATGDDEDDLQGYRH